MQTELELESGSDTAQIMNDRLGDGIYQYRMWQGEFDGRIGDTHVAPFCRGLSFFYTVTLDLNLDEVEKNTLQTIGYGVPEYYTSLWY